MFDTVETLSAKWEVLATKLRIQQHTVEAIKKNNPGDVDVCLNITLGQWLKLNYDYQKYGRPSWRIIAKSVQRMDPGLFEEIARFTGERNYDSVWLDLYDINSYSSIQGHMTS